MKKILLYLFPVLMTQTTYATVWIVDNNINSPQPIKDVQDAIDNYASVGDTIMVEGSPTSYGSFIVTKPLTLIGEGSNDNLGENATGNLITIRASNVFITGFSLTGGQDVIRLDAEGTPGKAILNITVERCYMNQAVGFFGSFSLGSPDLFHNIVFRNNIMTNFISTGYGSVYQIDTLIFENNILSHINFSGWGYNVSGINSVLIRNNIFMNAPIQSGNNGSTIFFNDFYGSHLTDAVISNNIFYASNPQGCNNCTFLNNLTYGNGANDTLPGPQNNNIYSQDPLFVNYPGGNFDYSFDFNLQAGSPAIDAGVGATDMGIKGGYYPYAVGEGPQIPVVDFVNLSSTAVPENKQVNLQFDAHIRK